MADIKYNITYIKSLAQSKLVTFTSDRIVNMEICRGFLPSPKPGTDEMATLRNDFQTKEAAYKDVSSETNKQARDKAYDALIKGHLDWIAYAELIIGDNADKAALFGYPQYATRTDAEVPTGVPPKPVVVLTPNPGEILLRAKPYKQDKKAIFYNWQVSEDGGQTYHYLPALGNSHRRMLKLELGKAYRFKVAYATTAGEGPFSEHVEVTLTRDLVGKEKKKAA